MQHTDKHYIDRIGWLRASVLGANDGIISTTSLVIGIAAATPARENIILAALAGLVAGAMSMAAGEYVSVSSQSDTERADLEREKKELETMPEEELQELTKIYEERGLSKELAKQVAMELTKNDALAAHARDELGINDITAAKPLQAAFSSFASFVVGALLPLLVAIFAPVETMIYYQYAFAILFLVLLGALSARTGGANLLKSIARVAFWGTIAMAASALVGHIFGVDVG
ncbi:MAG: VIT family protein [Flavobacteriaceae bacterium]|nr:VIT family protein [Flavobacteriaceae bacterium]MCB0475483.1 VIT family protein [Flavobacteriaceae bacterium]